jgi:hypothetical protein
MLCALAEFIIFSQFIHLPMLCAGFIIAAV